MTTEEIVPRVTKIIREHLGTDPHLIHPEASFARDLGCDSLDMVELTMAFEEEFHVTISDDEAAQAATVGLVVNLLADKLGA